MIKPSRRRQPKPAPKTELELHIQLARARSRQQRLIGASAVATGVSVILWLLGVPLAWHLGAVTLSFLAGLAYPVRGLASWALSWISQRAGLSYQTALELDQNDPYGFNEAIRKRALMTTNRLEPPQSPRWWLPLTALAFGLALLPFTPFRDSNRFAGVNVPSGLQGSPAATSDAFETETPEPETASQPESAADIPDTPSAGEDDPSTERDFDETTAEAPPEGVSSDSSEEEALSRFTENLSEREPPEQTNPFDSVPPETETQTSDEVGEGEPNTQAPSEGESQEQAQQGQGEQQAGEQEGSQEAGEQDASEGGQEETPSTDAQAEGEQQGEQESQGGQDSTASEASEQGAQEEQAGLEEGGNDAAGQGATAADASETTDLSNQEQAEPEFVQGQLDEGPSSLGGTVRLPGSDEDGASVTGSPGSFNQAEEQAITEGRIPVEYQDIVRNYFR